MNEQIRALLASNSGLPSQSITDDANLTRDLGLDSLDTVDLILQMEDQFKIAIPDEDYPKLQSVKQISAYLTEKLSVTA